MSGLDAKGDIVWRYYATGPIQVDRRSDGNHVINGTDLLNRQGRLVARLSDHAPAAAMLPQPYRSILDAAADTWGPIATLAPLAYTAPVFDDAGNVWLAVDDDDYTASHIYESVGTSGNWQLITTFPSHLRWMAVSRSTPPVT